LTVPSALMLMVTVIGDACTVMQINDKPTNAKRFFKPFLLCN
jgi:hypothetical protein